MTVLLHIRKTGGSALRDALGPYAAAVGLELPGHEVRLQDVPAGRPVVFTVREPVSRFVSGFNSRLRCGRPRNHRPWTPQEAQAFARFATPDALARALGADDPATADAAHAALAAIPHLRPLGAWLGSVEQMRARAGDIAAILWQPALDVDLARLARRLGLPAGLRLPRDDVGSHRTPEGFSTHVSPAGRRARRRCYREDFRLYGLALDMRAARARETPGR